MAFKKDILSLSSAYYLFKIIISKFPILKGWETIILLDLINMLELYINWSWTCYAYNFQSDILLHFRVKTLNVLFTWDILLNSLKFYFNIQLYPFTSTYYFLYFPKRIKELHLLNKKEESHFKCYAFLKIPVDVVGKSNFFAITSIKKGTIVSIRELLH